MFILRKNNDDCTVVYIGYPYQSDNINKIHLILQTTLNKENFPNNQNLITV